MGQIVSCPHCGKELVVIEKYEPPTPKPSPTWPNLETKVIDMTKYGYKQRTERLDDPGNMDSGDCS